MSNIFISHVEEDAGIARQIASGLEAAGYSTWYYERDTVPGASYLIQVTEAIDQCQAVVLVISPHSVGSSQVTKEVVHAFEKDTPFIPVLHGITHIEFQERQREWRHALGSSASVNIDPEGVSATVPRIIDGLRSLSIQPVAAQVSTLTPEPTPASYTPKHLADKIIAARPAMEGERKQVTVLFADVTGFTSMSEPLDPEETQDFIRPCLDYFTDEIHRYEGTIVQFLGDGAMALFGAPIAHEDDPQRALHAALGIQQRLRHYVDQLGEKGIEFELRIGVNTGLVVVGRIGDDLTMEYTPVGDTVDLASRTKNNAEPGTIQVAESTYRLTRGYFEFKPLSDVQVKGRKEPVKAYQVLGLGPVRTRLGVSVARGLTRFIGRRRELEHLADCYDRANEGEGQVVGVVGEAGVGKSRLVLEFRAQLPRDEYTWLEGQCLHYGGSMAYLPILDILRSYFDIKEGEQEVLIKSEIERRIAQLDEKLKGILPPLHDLMSLKVEDEEYLMLEPQQRRERSFEAIRNLLIGESQDKPLILVVDDFHWVDKTSEEFLTYLIGSLANAHILLLLLYRPEYTHAWASKPCYSQIRVDQLSAKSSHELVQSILEEGELEPELGELILSRAAGNPLFVEEFTHTLVENGSIQKKNHQYVLARKASDIHVPDTVQGIIAARIDRLEESLKRTMQVASVIGRDFAFRILHTITGMEEELKSHLFDLQGLDFIYEKSLYPELEYVFKHALTQEVAYDSLLLKRRREIHERIGNAIEELYPDRLEEFYEVLAHHYGSSEDSEKAYQYLKLSGDKAAHCFSTWEAFRFYREAINALGRLPETEDNKRRGIEARLSAVTPIALLGFPEDSHELFQEAETLCREVGDEWSLPRIYGVMGLYYSSRGDSRQGIEYCEKAFGAAEKVEDVQMMARTAIMLCSSYPAAGEFFKVAEVAPKVIALLESTHAGLEVSIPPSNVNVYSVLSANYGLALAMLGDFEKGEALCEQALRIALEIDNPYNIAAAELCYGYLLWVRGDGKNAVEHLHNAVTYCEEAQAPAFLGMAHTGLGHAYYLLGELETAREHAERAIKMAGDAGVPLQSCTAYLLLGRLHLESGDLENARACTEEALKTARDTGVRSGEGMSLTQLGRTLGKADRSQSGKAEEYILQGIRIVDELKLKSACAAGYLALGELYADTGQKDKALEALKKAEAAFQEMGMDYWLRRTQEVLARVEG